MTITSITVRGRIARGPFAHRWAIWGCGCVLLAVALGFRLWKLGSVPGINGDEAWYGVQAMLWLRGESVSWRTPTGNPMNPFYFAPLAAVHAMWGVGFWQLRSVAAASGVLALVVNFWLARRALGIVAAVISTTVLAVLPINLAYSRFGWDASQSLLFALPVVYCPLVALRFPSTANRWLLCGLLGFLAALLVHPTNIFLLPMLVIPAGMVFWTPVTMVCKHVCESRWRRYVVPGVGIILAAVSYALRDWVAVAAARAVAPSELGLFVGRYIDLLSGVTTYRFIPGSLIENGSTHGTTVSAGLLNLAMCAVLGLAIIGWWSRSRENASLEKGLLGGLFFTALGFFLVAGPGAIAPHFERYGICLIAPTVVAISIGLRQLFIGAGNHAPRFSWALAIYAGCCLFSFQGLYFGYFQTTGGRSHRAFRTAECEPKRSVIHRISSATGIEQGQPIDCTTLATSEWWTFWPLRYLAMGHNDLEVVQWADENDLAGLVERTAGSRIIFVEYADQPTLEQVRVGLVAREQPFREVVVNDAAGLPLLVTLAPSQLPSSNQDSQPPSR